MKENRKAVLVVVALFFGMSIIPSTGSNVTILKDLTVASIHPSTQTVEQGETFNVSVYVEPGELINAIGFGALSALFFEPSLIQANSVTSDDFFYPYYTVFNDGEIDNVNGEISGVGETIFPWWPGEGVSTPGSWVTIQFTAQQTNGTSSLILGDLFIVNDWGLYIYIIGNDGEVIVGTNDPPYEPNSPSPSDGATGVDINADLSWTGGDPDPGDIVTYDVYFGTTSPPPKVVANQSGTTYDPELDYNTTYYWKIVAWDDSNASTAGPIWSFTTMGIPPEITDVTLVASDPLDTEPDFGWENFSCTVAEDIAVDAVKLVLVGDTTTEYPMIKDGDDYYCNITITTADEYTWHIWANDTNNNQNTSTPEIFELPPNWDIDMDGECYFYDLGAVVATYGDTGAPGWIREDVDNDREVYFYDLGEIVLRYGETW